MTAPAAAMLTVGAAPDAFACALDNHCYSRAVDSTGHNNGISGNIYFTCLQSPTSQDFTDNEMWNVTGTYGTNLYYWTEAGVVDGAIQGTDHTRAWFWGDFRPIDSQVNQHFPSGFAEARYSTNYYTSIQFTANQTWGITGGNSGVNMGTSTDQPNQTIKAYAGSEFTDDQGMRDSGNVNGLQWWDGNGITHDWSTGGHVDTADLGANNNTNPSYDSSSSTISWNQC